MHQARVAARQAMLALNSRIPGDCHLQPVKLQPPTCEGSVAMLQVGQAAEGLDGGQSCRGAVCSTNGS